MKNYYKRVDGKVFPVNIVDNSIYLQDLYITELVTNAQYEYIDCNNNQLKELHLPDSCKGVDCFLNQLEQLIIPDGCTYINCFGNKLKELIIPEGCKIVYCDTNQIKQLIIPDGEYVWADMKSVTELNKVYKLRLTI